MIIFLICGVKQVCLDITFSAQVSQGNNESHGDSWQPTDNAHFPINTHSDTHTHTHTHTHAHTPSKNPTNKHIPTHTHTHTCMCRQYPTHTCTHNLPTHAGMHVHTHTHTHTHTFNTHTCQHTHTPESTALLSTAQFFCKRTLFIRQHAKHFAVWHNKSSEGLRGWEMKSGAGEWWRKKP